MATLSTGKQFWTTGYWILFFCSNSLPLAVLDGFNQRSSAIGYCSLIQFQISSKFPVSHQKLQIVDVKICSNIDAV